MPRLNWSVNLLSELDFALIFYKLAKTTLMRKTYILLAVFFLTQTFKSQTPYYKMLPADTMVWQHFDCYVAEKAANPTGLMGPLLVLPLIRSALMVLNIKRFMILMTTVSITPGRHWKDI
jgi:predicted cation transporter